MSGILLLVPLAVTVFILQLLYGFIVRYVRPVGTILSRIPIPEVVVGILAVLALLLTLYLLGALTRMMLGRKLLTLGESMLTRIPIVRTVYTSTKSLVDMLSAKNRNAFKSVVLVEFPRPGFRAVGFVGGEGVTSDGVRQVRVFLPTAPNPTSGFLLLVDESMVIRTKMTVEEGLRLVISGGVLVPAGYERVEEALTSAIKEATSNE